MVFPDRRRFPFDPRRRMMSVLLDDRLLTKGAPDSVLPRCRNVDGTAAELDRLAHRGLRVREHACAPATVPRAFSASRRPFVS